MVRNVAIAFGFALSASTASAVGIRGSVAAALEGTGAGAPCIMALASNACAGSKDGDITCALQYVTDNEDKVKKECAEELARIKSSNLLASYAKEMATACDGPDACVSEKHILRLFALGDNKAGVGHCIKAELDKFNCGDTKNWDDPTVVAPVTLYCLEDKFETNLAGIAKVCSGEVYGELVYDDENKYAWLEATLDPDAQFGAVSQANAVLLEKHGVSHEEMIQASLKSMTSEMHNSLAKDIAQQIANAHINAAGKIGEMNAQVEALVELAAAEEAKMAAASDDHEGASAWVNARKHQISLKANNYVRKEFKNQAKTLAISAAQQGATWAYENLNRTPKSGGSCASADQEYTELKANFHTYVEGPLGQTKDTADYIVDKIDEFEQFKNTLGNIDTSMGLTKNVAQGVSAAFGFFAPIKICANTVKVIIQNTRPTVQHANTKATQAYDKVVQARPKLVKVSEQCEKMLDTIETTKQVLDQDVVGNVYAVENICENLAIPPCQALYTFSDTVNTKVDEVEAYMQGLLNGLNPFKDALNIMLGILNNALFNGIMQFLNSIKPVLDGFNYVLNRRVCIPNPFNVQCSGSSGCSGCGWGGCSGCSGLSGCTTHDYCITIRDILSAADFIMSLIMEAVKKILNALGIPLPQLPMPNLDANFPGLPYIDLPKMDISLPGFNTINICGVNRRIQDCNPWAEWNAFNLGLSWPVADMCIAGSCADSPLGWYDSDGLAYNCGWYSSGTNCNSFGDDYANPDFGGKTAKQACCACGGGD